MIVSVDPTSPVPVFEQLRAQIERLIVAGVLQPGDALPPIRQLATDLDLARGTVNKAYEELARDGVVRSAGRRGTIVLPGPHRTSASGLDESADTLAIVARQLGASDADAHAALDRALARLRPTPQGGED